MQPCSPYGRAALLLQADEGNVLTYFLTGQQQLYSDGGTQCMILDGLRLTVHE